MREAASEGEHPTGLAAVRLMLLTGFRRMEVLGLERLWFNRKEHCIRFPDTKSGAQIRVLGEAAMDCIEVSAGSRGFAVRLSGRSGRWPFHRSGSCPRPRLPKAKLKDVTPHVLRHTFASVAGDLGFSELTIAGLLGHSARGVTQGYVHLDTALVVAADRVSAEIAQLLDGGAAAKHAKKMSKKNLATAMAA